MEHLHHPKVYPPKIFTNYKMVDSDVAVEKPGIKWSKLTSSVMGEKEGRWWLQGKLGKCGIDLHNVDEGCLVIISNF